MTQPAPAAPTGVPAWATRAAAAFVGLVPLIVAWIDPNNALPHGAVQAAVGLVPLAAGLAIFLVHLFHSDVHEYGWSMNALNHVATEAEAAFKQDWPQMKATIEAAQPALQALPGYQTAIDTVTADIAALKAREASSGLTPSELVAAFEQATGMTFPRATSDPNGAANAGAAPAAPVEPAA